MIFPLIFEKSMCGGLWILEAENRLKIHMKTRGKSRIWREIAQVDFGEKDDSFTCGDMWILKKMRRFSSPMGDERSSGGKIQLDDFFDFSGRIPLSPKYFEENFKNIFFLLREEFFHPRREIICQLFSW